MFLNIITIKAIEYLFVKMIQKYFSILKKILVIYEKNKLCKKLFCMWLYRGRYIILKPNQRASLVWQVYAIDIYLL